MIPVKLTLEGLYSYQERQTIDFSDLTDAGLFGIFGNVGSGKSSILEAIMFVLYGETERLNSKDKRAYNMMNLKSNLSYIEFDFYNFEQKLFRATREFKRNSKRFVDIKSPTVVFYEQVNSEWIPLNHSKAEEIIGLSYENFKRTIIIPQGQFKEFIELGAKDRTQMMKEIFGLHRYDLQDKVSALNAQNLTNLNQLQGKLSGFEEVSEEIITTLQEQLILDNELSKKIQLEYNQINEVFQRLKSLKNDFENLAKKRIEFEHLTQQKSEIDKKKTEIEQYELVYNAFHQLLIDLTKSEKEINEKSISIDSQKKQLLLIENHIKEISTQINLVIDGYNALPQRRQEEQDLEFIAQIQLFLQEIVTLKERTVNGVKKVEEVQLNQNRIEKSIKDLENKVKHLSEYKIDAQTLLDVGNWFSKQQNQLQSILNSKEKITTYKNQTEVFYNQLKASEITLSTFENDFILKFEELNHKKQQLENERRDAEVQQKLAHFTHTLHDGEACPLCGALNHPTILQLDNVDAKFPRIDAELKEIEDSIKIVQKQQVETSNIVHQLKFIEEQIKQENKTLENLEKESKIQMELFVWKGFDRSNFNDFEKKRKASINLEQTILDKNKLIAEQRILLEIERQNLDKYKQFLEKFRLGEIEKIAQINQNKSNLKILKFEDFENENAEIIKQKWSDLNANNLKIEQDYMRFSEILNDLNPKLASQKTSIDLLEKQLDLLKSESESISEKIKKLLEIHQIESVENVQQVLSLDYNVAKIRQEIEDFKISFETLKNSIKDLEQKFIEVPFDETIYKKQEEQFVEVTNQLKTANENVTKTKTEIERLTKSFEEKKDLLIDLDKLQKRATNLQTMRNLFNSAGFVQYVSSIYLKQLCDNANVRFHRMTRNQLSLQMNENNDFEIIDYLNEGRSRSVKTLSGGQSFQVSLSLALALAESVQTNAKSERNFFFIDEGFGTQDTDSVNIVFETLLSLQKENRIVGIISHVDELKDRIPVALQITKDEERGSLIDVI